MSQHIVTVPNDGEGKIFIMTFQKYLKNTPFRVMVRGRGNRKCHVGNGRNLRDLRMDLPTKLAERLAVYITKRPTHRLKRVMKPSWELVPTKWANVK